MDTELELLKEKLKLYQGLEAMLIQHQFVSGPYIYGTNENADEISVADAFPPKILTVYKKTDRIIEISEGE